MKLTGARDPGPSARRVNRGRSETDDDAVYERGRDRRVFTPPASLYLRPLRRKKFVDEDRKDAVTGMQIFFFFVISSQT